MTEKTKSTSKVDTRTNTLAAIQAKKASVDSSTESFILYYAFLLTTLSIAFIYTMVFTRDFS